MEQVCNISFENLHIMNWQLTLKSHIIKFVYLIAISNLNTVLFKGQGQESLVGHAKKFRYYPNVTGSH